jgi:hypothetical protein
VLNTSRGLQDYSLGVMNNVRNAIQMVTNSMSGNMRSTLIFPTANSGRYLNPSADFRYCGYMYYGLPRYVWISYALVNSAIGPTISIHPIEDGTGETVTGKCY